MSLFGTSPDDQLQPKQTTLFDDNPATGSIKNASSLFGDDDDGLGGGADSPWTYPPPKNSLNRADVVKTLLAGTEVPRSYVDVYDALLAEGDGGGISPGALEALLAESGLELEMQSKVLRMVVPSGQALEGGGIGRPEFNVLLALVGLALEGEDVTLDGVHERMNNLPELTLPDGILKNTRSEQETHQPSAMPERPPSAPSAIQPIRNTIQTTSTGRTPSYGFYGDPWNSPDAHRDHDHAVVAVDNSLRANGSGFARTTSAFTTVAADASQGTTGGGNAQAVRNNDKFGTMDSARWGEARAAAANGFSNPRFYAPPGRNDGSNDPAGAQLAGNSEAEEVVTITTIPEKVGIFFFQHRNYQVCSALRASKVVRRYSDFVWLLDCLHKRYPFRQLPLLPPKRVAINGNYLAADASFVEKRRRGLARFANALVRHPVLGQEQLVVMFLTVPTELAVWRKQATISAQDEFAGRTLSPGLEDSLSPTLQDTFDTVRSGVRRSAEMYINLCQLMERICKRNEGMAAEYLRFGLALRSLTEASNDTYAIETSCVPLLNAGLASTVKHLQASQSLLEDEARAWDEGVLEDLKTQRDSLVSMRDLFDRRDRLDRDNILKLERRIQSNESKLQSIRNKPEQLAKLGEAEKVEEAIVRDKQLIVDQHARGVFIKECVRDEIAFFQKTMFHVSRLHQDWSQERVKYAELQADNWRALSEEVDGMPLGN